MERIFFVPRVHPKAAVKIPDELLNQPVVFMRTAPPAEEAIGASGRGAVARTSLPAAEAIGAAGPSDSAAAAAIGAASSADDPMADIPTTVVVARDPGD
eukprot:11069455-Prorocentrum_lima.AAC.1